MQKKHTRETLGNPGKIVIYKTRHIRSPVSNTPKLYHQCSTSAQAQSVSWPSSSTMRAGKDRLWTLRREHVFLLSLLCHWHTESPPEHDNPESLQSSTALHWICCIIPLSFSLHLFSPCKEPLEHFQCRTAAGSMQPRPPGQLLSLRSSCAHSLMESAFFFRLPFITWST